MKTNAKRMNTLWRWAAGMALAGMAATSATGQVPPLPPPTPVPAVSRPGVPLEPPVPQEDSIQAAIRSAMREAERAVNEARRVGRRFGAGLAAVGTPASLVISDEADRGAVDALSEDLSVMSRILREKALGDGGDKSAWLVGVPMGQRGPDALYLEGFGALFLLSVDFPLVKPDEASSQKPATVEDETWERARREVRGVPGPRSGFGGLFQEEPVEYRAARVEELQRELTDTLRHARNIKGLKDADMITVVVLGPAPRSAANTVEVRRRIHVDEHAVVTEDVEEDEGASGRRQRSSMALRVTKADVDAFAAGRLDAAAFAQRVRVTVR